MDPRNRDRATEALDLDLPGFEQQDWEAIESGELAPDSTPENGDIRYEDEPTGELGDDDDDNIQESDEALPDDLEEAVLRRDPSKEGQRFDEI